MKNKKEEKVIGRFIAKGIFILVGLGMLVGSFFIYRHTSSFLKVAKKSQGVVIKLVPKRGSKGSTTYSPMIKFKTQKGDEFSFVGNTSSNPPSYHRGDKVDIFYNPQNPKNAKISSFVSLWLLPLILFGMGSVFTLIGIFGRFVSSRRRVGRYVGGYSDDYDDYNDDYDNDDYED
jgi:hypothetical protein